MRYARAAIVAMTVAGLLLLGLGLAGTLAAGGRSDASRGEISLGTAPIAHAGVIAGAAEALLAAEDTLRLLERQRETAAEAVSAARKSLAAEIELLGKVKALLDARRPDYRIGRTSCTRDELTADALRRAEATRRLGDRIRGGEEALAALDSAIARGRSAVSDARRRLGDVAAHMSSGAAYASAERATEVSRLAEALQVAATTARSELDGALRVCWERLALIDRIRPDSGSTWSAIDYGAMLRPEASSEIARVLDEHRRLSAGAIAAPTTMPAGAPMRERRP